MKFTSNITLILSFHTEMGKCNPQELYEILRNIKPDVIFEELPGHVFQSIYSGQKIPHTVESRAISSYIRYHNVNHVPVDTYEFDMLELFSEYDFIFERSELYKRYLKSLSYLFQILDLVF